MTDPNDVRILRALMPLLRGAVTFSRFRAQPSADKPFDPKRAVSRGLKSRAFEPLDRKGEDDKATGFVELENPEGVEFAVGNLFREEYALFGYRVDTLKVPGAQVKSELQKWAADFQTEQDRKPSRAETAHTRGQIRHQLRSRAVIGTKVHDVSWNLKTHDVQVWTAARKTVDEITLALEESLGISLHPRVPGAVALQAGVDDAALAPTPELIGGAELSEVNHG